MKRTIPVELKDRCIELYQETLDKDETDAIAVRRIKELFQRESVDISERTIYRYLQDWKRELSISSVIESYDVDLNRPKFISEDVMERLYKRFVQADEQQKTDQRSIIQWADNLAKYIEMVTKIEVLMSKKKTTSSSQEDTAKIVMIGVEKEANGK